MAWPEAVLFDFDGVIVESLDVKAQAFRQLFAPYPEKLAEILALHHRLGGISRFEKFRMIYADILKLPCTEATIAALGEAFAARVVDGVLACPMVAGAEAFLSRHAGTTPLLVVSGTPEGELRDIVARRGLDHHFQEVHGSPRGKPEIIGDILVRRGWTAERVLFVGDAESDYDAARATGLRFIGRLGGGLCPFPAGTATIPTLEGLDASIPQIFAQSETRI